MTSEYLFRHSDNELLHWSVALDGKPLASGEMPLDVAPQDKQLIELPELPQPESAGQLWLTVHVVQPNATAWSEAGHISAWQQWRLAENLSVTLPAAPHAIPQLTTSETDFASSWVINVGNLTASQAFFHRCGLALKTTADAAARSVHPCTAG